MLIKEIEINKIRIYENSRTEEGDVSGLMKSIEQNGLQHPIGVYEKEEKYILAYGYRRLQAAKKLGWKKISSVIIEEDFSHEDFLTKNTVENIHRQDLTPVELGRICQLFIDRGFTQGEIAAKLHIPKIRIETVYRMFQKVPKKYRNLIGFIQRGEDNKGKIPVNVAKAIISLRINIEEMDKLFAIARKKGFTIRHISLIHRLLLTGMSLNETLDNLGKCAIKSIFLRVDIKEYNKLDLERTFTEYIRSILRGEEPLNKKLFL